MACGERQGDSVMKKDQKVVKYEVEPTQGAAAFAMQMRLEGYQVVRVERKGTKATVTYEKQERT